MAKKLEEVRPEKFIRLLETTTRLPRSGEKNMFDYEFISREQFENEKEEMFETVEEQYLPTLYGGKRKFLNQNRWNIVVVSIEGFISAMKNIEEDEPAILINLLGHFVNRENRDSSAEERTNLGVLKNFIEEESIYMFEKQIPYIVGQAADVNENILEDIDGFIDSLETYARSIKYSRED